MVGNFIADSVKGAEINRFQEGIKDGIILHRKIDTFTDLHPIFCKSKNRLRTSQGKFSGVVTDIFYDHFLAVNWEKFCVISLEEFADRVYALMNLYRKDLPPVVQFILPRMISSNWLVNYANFYGIERSLEGMARRTNFPSNMHNALIDLQKDYEQYQNEFLEFFEEIRVYVNKSENHSTTFH
jgi:acyl carrier protein phosphodiesterase